jgi:hypothetical protein
LGYGPNPAGARVGAEQKRSVDCVRKCQEFVAAASLCALGACVTDSPPVEPAGGCSAQIIVTYAAPLTERARDALVADLERMTAVHLSYLRAVGPGVDVYAVTAESGCDDAFERVRGDPRVRTVDVDERRRPQA